MYTDRWNRKPPLGTAVNPEHPAWTPWVDGYLPLLEGTGDASLERAHGATTARLGTGGAAWTPGPMGGLAPRFTTACGWAVPGPGRFPAPAFTLAFWMRVDSLANQFVPLATGTYNANGWYLLVSAAGGLTLNITYAANATLTLGPGAGTVTVGGWHHWAVVVSGLFVYFYRDGVSLGGNYFGGAGQTTPLAADTPLYLNAFQDVSHGAGGTTGVNYSGIAAYDNVLLSRRALSGPQLADLIARPWPFFASRRSTAGVAAIAPEIAATPAVLYANGADQTLALVGFDDPWTAGSSPFSLVAPPAGVSIASQSVTDATHATVTLHTGTATGTVGLTDGTVTVTLPVQTPSIAVTPATIPADHPNPLTLHLAGAGTLWTGATAFQVSGVTGVAVVPASSSVASATSATVQVTTSAGTGALTVTDNVYAGTLAVAAPALAATITASPVVATGTYAVTLVGTGTVWTQEAAGSLFATSGIAGASISGVDVLSDTHATAMVYCGPPKAAGTLTITDASTGAATTIAVEAAPSGSLHATGTCLLYAAGDSGALFGSKSAATIAFRFKADSAAGLNTTSGTYVLGFSNDPGGVGLAVYQPASNTLAVTLKTVGSNPSTNTFSATVPVQVGTEYHLLISHAVAAEAAITADTTNNIYELTNVSPPGSLLYGDLVSAPGVLPPNTQVSRVFSATHYGLDSPAIATATGTAASVTRGTQALYVNGVSHTAGAVPWATYAYSQPRAGGSADAAIDGTATALDHGFSDLAIWGYAATAADALALANGATPLETGSSLLAWWPLGGGAVGSSPTTGDFATWLSDYSGAGNTLSLASGSLSGLAYAAAIGCTSPVVRADVLSVWGVLFFGATGAGPGNPLAPIIAVAADPTVHWNGRTIAKDGPRWFETTLDTPWVAYLPLCGAVDRIGWDDAGAGFTGPVSLAWDGTGGGTSLTIPDATLLTGVTGFTILDGGSGLPASPAFSMVSPLANNVGPTADTGASYNATASGGVLAALTPAAGGRLGCGTGYSKSNTFTMSVGVGTGGQLSATLGAGGAITAIGVVAGGGGYPGSGVQLNIADLGGTGSGAAATLTLGGNALWYATVSQGGSGYTNPCFTIAPAGCTANIRPVVSNYLAEVTAGIASSPDFTARPGLTITDHGGTPTRTPVPRVYMTGPAAGDTLTYDAPAGWMTPTIGGNPLGGLQAVTAQPITNAAGSPLEPAVGGLGVFAAKPTLGAGANTGEYPADPYINEYIGKNLVKCPSGWSVGGGGTLTAAADGTPISWTQPGNTTLTLHVLYFTMANGLDGQGAPTRAGQWLVYWEDSQAGKPGAASVSLDSRNGANFVSSTTNGTATTAIYEIGYGASPTTWELDVVATVTAPANNNGQTDGTAQWTISGLAVVQPDPITGLAMTWDPNRPLAPDDGVVAALTTPAGGQPAALRWMDATLNSGGSASIIMPDDLNRSSWESWKYYRGRYATAHYGRRFNPDPNNSTYSWHTNKVYGPQPFMTTTDPSYSMTGTLTLGQPTIAGLSGGNWGGGLMAAATVAGPGVPAGAYVAGITGANSCTLANPDGTPALATASGAVTLTVTDPPYILVPATSSGEFCAHDNQNAVIELRFDEPHGLLTGALCPAWSGPTAGAVPLTNVARPFAPGSTNGLHIWVTGPYTLLTEQYLSGWLNADAPPSNYYPQQVASTTEIDLTNPRTFTGTLASGSAVVTGIASTADLAAAPYPDAVAGAGVPAGTTIKSIDSATQVTLSAAATASGVQTLTATAAGWFMGYDAAGGAGLVPYDAAVAMSQGCGAAAWLNVSWPCSTLLATEMGRLAASVADANTRIQVEYANEIWNGGGAYSTYPVKVGRLMAYVPAGTTMLGRYTSTGGYPISNNQSPYGVTTLLAGRYFDLILEEWTAQGRDPSQVEHVLGQSLSAPPAWFGSQDAVRASQVYGYRIDRIAPTAYVGVSPDYPIWTAYWLPGSRSDAGAWPAGALNDLYRWWMAYNGTLRAYFGAHAQAAAAYGQPTDSCDATQTNATAYATLTPTGFTVAVGSGGANYTNPTATATGGDGTYTSLSVQFTANGPITGITVNGATGYTTPPTFVTISDPTGSGATATATLVPTSVGSLAVSYGGVGYLAATAGVQFRPNDQGTGASATATISGGVVTGFTNLVGGSGYTVPPTVEIYGGGGGLGQGEYYVCYTFEDAQGRETTVGLSRSSPVGIGTGDIPTLAMPGWPPWAQSMNIYITGPIGRPGTETFYQSIPRSAYGTTYPIGARVPLAIAIPAATPLRRPPATNLAAANNPNAVTPVNYEGAPSLPAPGGIPFFNQMCHDLRSHPSMRQFTYGFFGMCQAGGMTETCYYQLYNGIVDNWVVGFGSAQPPGDGISHAYQGSSSYSRPANQYATVIGGYPADNHDHSGGPSGNTSPAMQGLRDWMDAVAVAAGGGGGGGPYPKALFPDALFPAALFPGPESVAAGLAGWGTMRPVGWSAAGRGRPGRRPYRPALVGPGGPGTWPPLPGTRPVMPAWSGYLAYRD